MIKFPSINQFRNTVKAAKGRAQYVGRDALDEPIFNSALSAPVIRYQGTVKLHGTNAGIVLSVGDPELQFQSRERVLTVNDDNAGFMNAQLNQLSTVNQLFEAVAQAYGAEVKDHVALFGEWCGGNIQKGVAISGLPKMFVIFAVQIDGAWVNSSVWKHIGAPAQNIYNIHQFPTYTVDIDFERPHAVQNQLSELTMAVEAVCPVGAQLGQSGVGEGIVWMPEDLATYDSTEYWFKVKGEKHSVTKVKTLAEVDVEAINALNEFVERVVTEQRLEQGLDNLVREQRKPFELASLGDFIRWVYNDVTREEADVIAVSGFDVKKLGGPIANVARRWYLNRYNAQP